MKEGKNGLCQSFLPMNWWQGRWQNPNRKCGREITFLWEPEFSARKSETRWNDDSGRFFHPDLLATCSPLIFYSASAAFFNIFSFHNKHPLPSSLPFIRLVFSCKNVSDKTFSLLQCRNFLCVPCQPSGTLWILFRKKKRWKINCIKQMRMHNLGGFSLPLKGNFANLAAALICTAVSISCVASSGCSNTDMQLEEMGVRTAQEISAESWSTCSLLCSSSNAPKGGKLRPKSRQLSRVSALEGFGWRFSVWTRYYVFVSFVREGVGDYGLDLNIEFGRRILITEEGEWLLNSVLQCNAGLDSKLKLRVYFLMMRMDFNVLIWVL